MIVPLSDAKSVPVLEGYGEVEHCYKFPDKSIPTCDGSDYVEPIYDGGNYCYIPSLGCNQWVVMEGVLSYMVGEYGKQYESIEVLSSEEEQAFESALRNGELNWLEDGVCIYCRMVYPYVGKYVMEPASLHEGKCSWIDIYGGRRACDHLFADFSSYNCYQNPADADERCWDDLETALFADEEEEELLLPLLFLSEIILDEVPCELGISYFKTSTGLSFSLYAEKYTEPSLVVGYNDGKCYGKLEAGKATGTINFNYNGTVYHLVD
ncbi:MAG: hypothetical protein J6R52_02690 [Alphaproteobacteria bacterium]|nr:hypothetical protein [Alphaproteobacteria bacterium]